MKLLRSSKRRSLIGDFQLPDSRNQLRRASSRLKPALSIKGGQVIEIGRILPEYLTLVA